MDRRVGMRYSIFGSILLLSLLISSCLAAPGSGLFDEADHIFVVENTAQLDCLTREPVSSSEFLLTKAGIGWQRNGEELDILLEYGGIDEFRERTYVSIGFLDRANPPIEINDPHPRSVHSRATTFAEMSWGEKNWPHTHFWQMNDRAKWIEPSVIRFGDEFEMRGNQVRISVPAGLLGVSGSSDPRISDLSWVVITGNEDDPDSCVEPETSWPLDLAALQSFQKAIEKGKRIKPQRQYSPLAAMG